MLTEDETVGASGPLDQLLRDLLHLSDPKVSSVTPKEKRLIQRLHDKLRRIIGLDWSGHRDDFPAFANLCRVVLSQLIQSQQGLSAESKTNAFDALEATVPSWEALCDSAVQGLQRTQEKAAADRDYMQERATLQRLNLENANLKAELAKLKTEAAEQALNVVQGEKVSEAAQSQSLYFGKLASRYFWESFAWAILALIMALMGIRYVDHQSHTLRSFFTPETWIGFVHEFGPRALIVSIYSFIMVWAAGNARAAQHNRTLNDHRQAAMDVFPEFKHASLNRGDLFTQVIFRIMDMIYREQPTGFYTSVKDKEKATAASGLINDLADAIKKRIKPNE